MEAKSGTSYEDRHPADEYRVNVTLGIDVTIEETVNIPDEYATIRVWITDNQSVRIFTETV